MELLRRDRAAESLIDYSQSIEIPGAPVSADPDEWMFRPIESSVAHHHRVFMQSVQDCIEEPFGRLIIMAPPGSAKSTYVGVVATTWAMGRYPGYKIVSTSYASPPALRSARKCQQICRSPEYQAIWDHTAIPLKGSSGVEEWSLSNGSSMLSAGLMGGITSSRADLGIVDDPVAGREEADSEPMRNKTRLAYDDDLLTRLKPNASIIIIMTRWNEDDLVGSILPSDYAGESGRILCRDSQVWNVVNMPAEAEHQDDPLGRKLGDMLWPEWFTPRHWAIYRGNPRTWSALFQQRPAPTSGGQFEKGDFKRYKKTPAGLKFWLSTDFALTKKLISNRPDKTEHQVWGVDADAELYLDCGVTQQDEPEITIPAAIDFIKRFKPLEWLMEAGGIYNAVQSPANRQMKEAKAMTVIEKMPSSQDKVLKASALRIMAKQGKVWVKEGPYGDHFIAQACSFPYGAFDDAVDAGGQVARRIDDMYAPRRETKIARRPNVNPLSAQALELSDREVAAEERRKARFLG